MPAALGLRHRPEKYGLLPDGDSPSEVRDAEEASSAATEVDVDESRELTVREALKSRTFWMITIGFSFSSFAFSQIIVHEISYFISIGFSAGIGALGMLILTTSGFVGRVVFGWLGDIYKK